MAGGFVTWKQKVSGSSKRSSRRSWNVSAPRSGLSATADRLRQRHRLSARGHCSAYVGVVPLQPFAKAEPPACSDLEVDPVRPQRAPGGDPTIGGDYHAVDEAGSAESVEADAQI